MESIAMGGLDQIPLRRAHVGDWYAARHELTQTRCKCGYEQQLRAIAAGLRSDLHATVDADNHVIVADIRSRIFY